MGLELVYSVAVIDKDLGFCNALDVSLGRLLRSDRDCGVLRDDYRVRGYRSLEDFKEDLPRPGALRVFMPMLMIADSAAREPTVQEGALAFATDWAPRCKKVYYSWTMEQFDELNARGFIDRRIDRKTGEAEAFVLLAAFVRSQLRHFEEGLDGLAITSFLEILKRTADPQEPSVAWLGSDEEESDLSPLGMLIEMIRGTDLGRGYLRDLWLTGLQRPSRESPPP
jgi:hypothetical protein